MPTHASPCWYAAPACADRIRPCPAVPPRRTADPFDYESALEACARGERFALRALYEREARWLLGVALRIVRDRDMAHDVLQDAFLQVWQRASSYQRALGSARGWIYTVVRHRALDEVRRVRRETPVGDELEALADQHAASNAVHELPHADAASLSRCMETLDERKRDCIVYAFVEGYTHEQIAQQTATPVGTVKSWIRRGLLSLKECLS
ncbi:MULTISPECIES: sigma-70 family RNA polymerase sigma factor [unclassified Methylibium]|uniref:sigma-70 family RNA polymerase sigma factor n=1 Tax=unclassified Methylibium TaxID=2633235 RepID=UPI0003F3D1F3|nr:MULTISPECIES: sigma-70 family RNA polymerase sigma factor [unclassified Methylibium]EWS54290.1 Sigma-K factor [Methylibium sp. T29]EWS58776.1 Sigma-K factor [Methylibium sp. T29-B]